MNTDYYEYKTDELYEIKGIGTVYVIHDDDAYIEVGEIVMINGVLGEVIRKERNLCIDDKYGIVIRKIKGERK